MARIGINPEEARSLANRIKTDIENIMGKLKSNLQDVEGIAEDNWCADGSVRLFEVLNQALGEAGPRIYDTVQASIQAIIDAANAYLAQLENSNFLTAPTVDATPITLELNVQKDKNGEIFVETEQLDAMAQKVIAIENEINDLLTSFYNAVVNDAGNTYSDERVVNAVTNYYNTITEQIKKIFTILYTGDDTFGKAIEDVRERLEQESSNIQNAFDNAANN